MSLVNIKIEGIPYQVESGLTILEAARKCGYEIPSLCAFNHGECNQGSCRVCLVEATGARGLVASCVYPVSEGMEIRISTPKAIEARRRSVELLLSNHSKDCQQCDKNGSCELLYVAQLTGAREKAYEGVHSETTLDVLAPALIRDTSKCILCGRCIARCQNAHGLSVLGFENRGFNTIVAPAQNRSFQNSPCIQCGQCVSVCPTGALMEKSEIDKVFDTDWGADLTIMEEANELVERISKGGKLPMITSCSPGWINYAECNYADLLPHVSSCKSPHQMQGAIIKSYWAKQNGYDPKEVFVVSVMPCVAKKFEKDRPMMENDGIRDVDAVITTRELAKMIRRSGIRYDMLPDEDWDQDIMGDYTGAAVIFGVTGGVMEAALRTVYYKLTGKEYGKITFDEVRGHDAGVREATLDINGTKVSVAIASGMKSAKILLDEIRAGKSKYQFIEIMGCPGGCINGGGQPYIRPVFLPHEDDDILDTYKEKRAKALYTEDERQTLRQSHKNPQVIELYEKFLGEPNSHLAHELLHTHYEGREAFR